MLGLRPLFAFTLLAGAASTQTFTTPSPVTAPPVAARTQPPFPAFGADPSGVVVDEKGKPIAGAGVALRWDPERSRPWSRSIEQVLRKTPLPSTTTDRDGEFVLPLTNEQRSLGACGEGYFWLQAEHEGKQRWCERLTLGLAGFLGSRVTLPPLRESDRVELTVLAPRPSSRLEIRRLWADDPDPGVAVEVPDDGRVSAPLPLVPCPKPGVTCHELLPLGYRARLVAKGYEGFWQPIEPGSGWREVDLGWRFARPAPAAAARPDPSLLRVRVCDRDGAPIRGARLLVEDEALVGPDPLPDPFRTDDLGEARIALQKRGAIRVRVRAVADGWYPEEGSTAAATREDDRLDLVLERSRTVRLATAEADAPVAHVRWKLQPNGPVSLWARDFTTDSLGRAQVTLPQGLAFRSMLWHGQGVQHLQIAELEDVQRFVVGQQAWCAFRVGFDTRLEEMSFQTRSGGGSGLSSGREVAGAIAYLAGSVCGHLRSMEIKTTSGASFSIAGDDLDRADRQGDVAWVSDRAPDQRIPVRVRDADGKPLLDARIWMQTAAPQSGAMTGDGLQVVPRPDGVYLLRREKGEVSALVSHPSCVRSVVPLPEAKPAAPLEARLVRGALLRIRVVPKDLGLRPGAKVQAAISVALPDGTRELRTEAQVVDAAAPERPIELVLPEALPPGEWAIKVQLGAKVLGPVSVPLDLGKPVVLDFVPMNPLRLTLATPCLAVTAFAQGYVYSPAACAVHEGASLNAFPFGNVFHYQQMHADLKGTAHVWKGLAWRRDGGDATAGQLARTLDLEVFMGEGDYAALTTTFATNYTNTPANVFLRKTFSLPDHSVRPDSQPTAWDVKVLFDTLYVYLGLKDLIWEMVIRQTSSTGAYVCDAYAPGLLDAQVTSSGTGCTTQKGVMKLRTDLTSTRSTGTWDMTWSVASGPANAPSGILVGITNPSFPVPGLCSGALLYTDGALFTLNATTNASGAITATPSPALSLAVIQALVGTTFTAQAAALDPAQPLLAIAASNGNTILLPPLMPVPVVQIARLYSIANATATTGMLTKSQGLVTRFEYDTGPRREEARGTGGGEGAGRLRGRGTGERQG